VWLNDLFHNQVFIAALVAVILAQVIKVPYNLAIKRQLNWGLLLSAGGMPSSHSALVTSLATAIGITEGFDSPMFAITVVLAMVVMYDASGVRRAASKQARILNIILDQLFAGQPISDERLKELLGHTPVEVIAGAIMGIFIAIWMVR
jgi:uncharacterized protein